MLFRPVKLLLAMPPLSSLPLESVFNHIALPPKLPGEQDSRIDEIETALTARLLDAVGILQGLLSDEYIPTWDHIRRSLEIASIVNQDGRLNRTSLVDAFSKLKEKQGLILHVAAQNAGLLIRREVK